MLASGPEPAAIAKAIDDLAAHPERIEKMSETMLAHRDEKKQSIQIEKLLKIYQGK